MNLPTKLDMIEYAKELTEASIVNQDGWSVSVFTDLDVITVSVNRKSFYVFIRSDEDVRKADAYYELALEAIVNEISEAVAIERAVDIRREYA